MLENARGRFLHRQIPVDSQQPAKSTREGATPTVSQSMSNASPMAKVLGSSPPFDMAVRIMMRKLFLSQAISCVEPMDVWVTPIFVVVKVISALKRKLSMYISGMTRLLRKTPASREKPVLRRKSQAFLRSTLVSK